MIIALVNSKGGVGKSTIAGNLTGWLHVQGHKVLLADCDAQRSASEWIREAAPEIDTIRFENADQVFEELPSLSSHSDYIVCDGPGSQMESSRALLMWADLAIIPTKAGIFEARALRENTTVLRQAQAIRRGEPQAVAVLSMVGEEYRLTRDMVEAAKAIDLPLAETKLCLRQAFADAPGQAKFVWDMGPGARKAADEIDALFRKILPEVSGENLDSMEWGATQAVVNG